jgi:SAM-dependent methyltransferase
MRRETWERLGMQPSPAWYLDPLAAHQKREAHLELIRWRTAGIRVERALKTDLFEDAFGEDRLLDVLFPEASLMCGMDEAVSTTRAAVRRMQGRQVRALVTDVRHLGLCEGVFDVIVSASTLDHFDVRADYLQALQELAWVLRPGGLLVITMDNPWNPLYLPLRWRSRNRLAPFPLGYTPSVTRLERDLRGVGLEPEARDWLLHNPRGVSTALFLGLRSLLGRRGDGAVKGLLAAFDLLGRLPTGAVTACFQAVTARKPVAQGSAARSGGEPVAHE